MLKITRKDGQVFIDSQTGDPAQDMRIIVEALGLCILVNARRQRVKPNVMKEFIRKEIDRVTDRYESENVIQHKAPSNFIVP